MRNRVLTKRQTSTINKLRAETADKAEWQDWENSADGTSTPRDGVSTTGVSGSATPMTSGTGAQRLKITFNSSTAGASVNGSLTNGDTSMVDNGD